jgi:ubiquinone/menaquinone biosynthesis C-methylase UbiE
MPRPDAPREVELRLTVESDAALDELERVLLKARATELAEVRRQDLRHTAGYGDATSREVMGETGRTARLRYELLTRLIEAIRRERTG